MKRLVAVLCVVLLAVSSFGAALAQQSVPEKQSLSDLFRTAEWRLYGGMSLAELDAFIAEDGYAPHEKIDLGDGVVEYRYLPYAALRVKGDPVTEAWLVAECAEHGVIMEVPFVLEPARGAEGSDWFSQAMRAEHNLAVPGTDAWKTWLAENGKCFRAKHDGMSDVQRGYLEFITLGQAIPLGTPAKELKAIGDELVKDGWLGRCTVHTMDASGISFQGFPIDEDSEFDLRFVSVDGQLACTAIMFLSPNPNGQNTRIGGLLNIKADIDWYGNK